MDQWYYGKDGQQQGPVDLEQIRSLVASGQLAPSDLVWKEGMANWTAVNQVPELTAHNTQHNTNQGGQGGYQQGGYQQGGYQQGGYNQGGTHQVNYGGYGAQKPGDANKNSMAVTSLVLGILSIFPGCFCIGLFGLLPFACGIPAIITGKMGMVSQQPGMAKTGLICGIIGCILGVIGVIWSILIVSGVIDASQFQQQNWNFQ